MLASPINTTWIIVQRKGSQTLKVQCLQTQIFFLNLLVNYKFSVFEAFVSHSQILWPFAQIQLEILALVGTKRFFRCIQHPCCVRLFPDLSPSPKMTGATSAAYKHQSQWNLRVWVLMVGLRHLCFWLKFPIRIFNMKGSSW